MTFTIQIRCLSFHAYMYDRSQVDWRLLHVNACRRRPSSVHGQLALERADALLLLSLQDSPAKNHALSVDKPMHAYIISANGSLSKFPYKLVIVGIKTHVFQPVNRNSRQSSSTNFGPAVRMMLDVAVGCAAAAEMPAAEGVGARPAKHWNAQPAAIMWMRVGVQLRCRRANGLEFCQSWPSVCQTVQAHGVSNALLVSHLWVVALPWLAKGQLAPEQAVAAVQARAQAAAPEQAPSEGASAEVSAAAALAQSLAQARSAAALAEAPAAAPLAQP